MENAVIYARYSSHNQTENSIEAQVEAAKKFAKSHKYNVIEVYADRAKTGTNDNREAFQQMLRATDRHTFSVIIVWKVDRFGRNREEIALNKYRCKKNGVRVEYVAENIIDGPEGVILESILEGFAEYYSRALSQNCKRGIKNIAMKGEYTGGKPPYGYKIVDGKYTVVPEEAKKIKEVFKLFNSGLNFSEIARTLDLSYYNIRIYLSNKSYYDGVYRRLGVNIEGIIPPIITKQDYDMVQSRLNSYTKRKKPDEYILTGKIHCKSCGKKFTGCGSDPKYKYYRSTCKCAGHLMRIRKCEIEASTHDSIVQILESDSHIEVLVDAVHSRLTGRILGISSKASKESLLTRRKRLLDAFEKGVLEMNELSERLAALDETLAKITQVPEVPSKAEIKDFILEFKNKNSTRVLVENLVENIIVNPEDLSYEIKFGLPNFGTH